MKTLVTYQSKTGFTKKYADWIAQELSADIKEIAQTTASEVANYDQIIHGGWIMGGMVNGLDKARAYHPSKLIVFGVGFTSKEEVEISKMIEANKLANTPFFYYEGGMNPKKMGFMGRTMIKMVMKKTPEYSDHTNKAEIKAIVELARKTY